jgi:DNA polymerase III epsilon subunit-like protein
MLIDIIREKVGQSQIVRSLVEAEVVKPSEVISLDIETGGHEGRPGDSPVSPYHGLIGVALCNAVGQSMYLVVNESGRYPQKESLPVSDAVTIINNWLSHAKIVVLHNHKFDCGFLEARGVKFERPGLRIRDTWIINSIRCNGVFKSNKLKDIIKEKFSIDTSTKTAIDDFFAANNTKDYAHVPLEILAPYAEDDVRYTLMLYLHFGKLTETEAALHDRYVRNSFALSKAYTKGLVLKLARVKAECQVAESAMRMALTEIEAATAGQEFDRTDAQKVLQILHSQGQHPPPRDFYGETKFVVDESALEQSALPLAAAFLKFHRNLMFLQAFSPSFGDLFYHVTTKGGVTALHPDMMLSVFSQGGQAVCKRPDFVHALALSEQHRRLFQPHAGNDFVRVKAFDLFSQLLAYYASDTELLKKMEEGYDPVELLAARAGMELPAAKAVMKNMAEGSGNVRLEALLTAAGVRRGTRKGYTYRDKLTASLAGWVDLNQRISKTVNENGIFFDRLKRPLFVAQAVKYKALTALIKSSAGSVMALALDCFTQLAEACGGRFAWAHETELVFEVPAGSVEFYNELKRVCCELPVEPRPLWTVKQGPIWGENDETGSAD